MTPPVEYSDVMKAIGRLSSELEKRSDDRRYGANLAWWIVHHMSLGVPLTDELVDAVIRGKR